MDNSSIDTGTAYGMKPRICEANRLEVSAGGPMREFMCLYRHPCFGSDARTCDMPRRVRLLGEDLMLFRDEQSQAGWSTNNTATAVPACPSSGLGMAVSVAALMTGSSTRRSPRSTSRARSIVSATTRASVSPGTRSRNGMASSMP